MSAIAGAAFPNARAIPVAEVTRVASGDLRATAVAEVSAGGRLLALFGRPLAGTSVRLLAVFGHDEEGTLRLVASDVDGSYPALTPGCPQAHWFEREIFEQWAVRPEDHPWLKPIRFQPPRVPATAKAPEIGVTDFFHMEGEEVHEVAVGPVHAGVIEPGHFRFSCHGEKVFHLEISLGYQHRGVERALVGGPSKRTIHYMETLAGDTTVGHATAYCEAVEALAACQVPPRAEAIRGIALELERLANHAGDLGALANDVGYLPTASYCGRIRGDFLNATALICGSRFGRGLVRPGGVVFDIDAARAAEIDRRLDQASRDVAGAVLPFFDTPSVLGRLEGTGRVSAEACRDVGLVGPAARASGLERDVRQDYPSGIFRFAQIPVSSFETGDVFARAIVRWIEIQCSIAFVREQVRALPVGPIRQPVGALARERVVVSLCEGWRGEICHVVETDADGKFACYKVVDPSFHNWFGLALALRNQQISDFPLCNKSFNLSYCGHDL